MKNPTSFAQVSSSLETVIALTEKVPAFRVKGFDLQMKIKRVEAKRGQVILANELQKLIQDGSEAATEITFRFRAFLKGSPAYFEKEINFSRLDDDFRKVGYTAIGIYKSKLEKNPKTEVMIAGYLAMEKLIKDLLGAQQKRTDDTREREVAKWQSQQDAVFERVLAAGRRRQVAIETIRNWTLEPEEEVILTSSASR